VIGVGEREPDATRAKRTNHQVELIWTNLEAINACPSSGTICTDQREGVALVELAELAKLGQVALNDERRACQGSG
jgi:hypothetical protein